MYGFYGLLAFLAERRRRTELRRAFSLYVSPEVVDHVMADPERLKLGGERREIQTMPAAAPRVIWRKLSQRGDAGRSTPLPFRHGQDWNTARG